MLLTFNKHTPLQCQYLNIGIHVPVEQHSRHPRQEHRLHHGVNRNETTHASYISLDFLCTGRTFSITHRDHFV